jgi:hypothetical protein
MVRLRLIILRLGGSLAGAYEVMHSALFFNQVCEEEGCSNLGLYDNSEVGRVVLLAYYVSAFSCLLRT